VDNHDGMIWSTHEDDGDRQCYTRADGCLDRSGPCHHLIHLLYVWVGNACLNKE